MRAEQQRVHGLSGLRPHGYAVVCRVRWAGRWRLARSSAMARVRSSSSASSSRKPASSAAMPAARSCGLGDTFQSSHARCVTFRSSFSRNYRMDGDVAPYLARWKPARGTPAAAAAFARAVVAASAPGNTERAKCLLWAAGKLAAWATGLGMDPAPEVLLHPSVIERFAAHAPGISAVARRSRATALVCLGAGAGLIRSDLRNARGSDVIARSGGVVVQVRGTRPRAVPILARYQPRLLEAASF